MWDLLSLICWILDPLGWWCWWWKVDHAAELDDDWRRWLFGAVVLIGLAVMFVGFCYLATFLLPKHGK